MAQQLRKLDSVGGFSVNKLVHIDESHNGKGFNSLELKNSNFSDSSTVSYLMRGENITILSTDNFGSQVPLADGTVNFICGNLIAVDPVGNVFSLKLESVVFCDVVGNTTVLSTTSTIFKDDIPNGQSWTIVPISAVNTFSYNTNRVGTTNLIKWFASVQVSSISWS